MSDGWRRCPRPAKGVEEALVNRGVGSQAWKRLPTERKGWQRLLFTQWLDADAPAGMVVPRSWYAPTEEMTMQDYTKVEPGRTSPGQRPPPLPPQKARPGAGSGFAKVKAFVEIRRLRVAEALRRTAGWVRRRKLAAAIVGLGLVLAVAGGLAFAFDALPSFGLFAPKNLAEARANTRTHPGDASAQRDLGHALFAAKHPGAAVAAYRKALALDAGIADDRMIDNLVALFGSREQDEAEALIWKNQLVGAQKGIEPLVGSRRYGVRWGAVQTLDRLKKGSKTNWETAYLLDLESPTCDVRRRAVEKLGAIGTRRAVRALHAAKAADEKTGGWFRSRCLGERLEVAEREILQRR
jgi:hypothetical protein